MTKEIFFTNEKVLILDDDDYENLKSYNITLHRGGYAIRHIQKENKSVVILIHREITNAPSGMVVDHINGNKLDNRKENLRVCTQSQNSMNRRLFSKNSSGHKGVSWCKTKRKWQAQIMLNGKQKTIGRFHNIEDAILAYKKASQELFGEFARVQNESI